eukprot:COSAG01_NODE_33550_length_562_cov_1.103672_1_plen_109_part_10
MYDLPEATAVGLLLQKGHVRGGWHAEMRSPSRKSTCYAVVTAQYGHCPGLCSVCCAGSEQRIGIEAPRDTCRAGAEAETRPVWVSTRGHCGRATPAPPPGHEPLRSPVV